MQIRTLLAGLAVGTLAASANAAIVTSTLTVNVAADAGTSIDFLQNGVSTAPGDPFPGENYVSPGAPPDYIAGGTPVVFSYDFGGAVTVASFNAGLYLDAAHGNTATQYTIDLGTTAGGNDIADDIVVNYDHVAGGLQNLSLGGEFTGVLFATATITDNGFEVAGGNAGGDRVGTSEASFDNVPEPGSLALLGLGGLALLRRRR